MGCAPVGQGEGDQLSHRFARATDAGGLRARPSAAQLAPIKLRIGVQGGDPVTRRREIHRPDHQPDRSAARSRPRRPALLSGAMAPIVIDQLHRRHAVRHRPPMHCGCLPRPNVIKLGPPDLPQRFPAVRHLPMSLRPQSPAQLTSLIGRRGRAPKSGGTDLITGSHLKGVGRHSKTRLAGEGGHERDSDFPDGDWYVDLATIYGPSWCDDGGACARLTVKPARSTIGDSHACDDHRTLVVSTTASIDRAAPISDREVLSNAGETLDHQPATLASRVGTWVCRRSPCRRSYRVVDDRARRARPGSISRTTKVEASRDMPTPRRLRSPRAGRGAHPRPLR